MYIYIYHNYNIYIYKENYFYNIICKNLEQSRSKGARSFQLDFYYAYTCRDIQTAIIKTCAYNNRFALKCAFGESYNELYPGTIYSPPSYDVRFPSAIMSS